MTRCLRFILRLCALLLSGWAALAALYSPAFAAPARAPLAALILLAAVLSVIPTPARSVSRILASIVFAVVAAGWLSLVPSNTRDWSPDVSEEPWAEVEEGKVIIHNVRNFRYRSSSDFDARYETRSYNPEELSGVDFAVSYWGGKNIGHVMTSFSFADRDFLTFSVETRKEKMEAYSALAGFFRNYELVYVAGDERDLFGVRTTHRRPPEEVYLVRTRMPIADARRLFEQYLIEINELRERPVFYNTLTTNCTTQILKQAQAYSTAARYNWRILLSGHVPQLLYESGKLAPDLPLDEILRLGLINERSIAARDRADYSQYIRRGVPRPEPLDSSNFGSKTEQIMGNVPP